MSRPQYPFSRLLTLGLLTLSLAACSTLGPHDPVRINLVGLEPLPAQGLEMRFAVKLRVQNPNDRAIDYNGVALDLQVNDQPLASGVSDQSGQVPRFGESVLSVPVSISALSVFRQAWGMAGNPPRQNLPYVLRGKLSNGWWGTERFSDTGVLSLPQPAPAP
ncbi:water stress/hypersensitive response domain-containing protein [Pseudomonas cavernae]|uniref:Water stress/hypersensitive response domain-containing protein n=1 Tax=Pseudomonas cavernae TaxID=2320867 RepID=A0A385YX86_9PSED|nr:LEA type 2 family protein [Pseudomonas cavernae]AYC31535.1 water stress/hypersensitive response domain-containing protein [Pseudomonas cavernae]